MMPAAGSPIVATSSHSSENRCNKLVGKPSIAEQIEKEATEIIEKKPDDYLYTPKSKSRIKEELLEQKLEGGLSFFALTQLFWAVFAFFLVQHYRQTISIDNLSGYLICLEDRANVLFDKMLINRESSLWSQEASNIIRSAENLYRYFFPLFVLVFIIWDSVTNWKLYRRLTFTSVLLFCLPRYLVFYYSILNIQHWWRKRKNAELARFASKQYSEPANVAEDKPTVD